MIQNAKELAFIGPSCMASNSSCYGKQVNSSWYRK